MAICPIDAPGKVADLLLEDGFCVCTTTGSMRDLVDHSLACAAEFYALPVGSRFGSRCSLRLTARGYRMSEESLAQARALGLDVAPEGSQPEPSGRQRNYDSFDVGAVGSAAGTDLEDFLFCENVWPDGCAELRREIQDLFDSWLLVASRVGVSLAGRSGHAQIQFDRRCVAHLRLLRYPASGATVWSREHTDYELLTFITADGPGLEILDEGRWRLLPFSPGCVVALAGDALEVMTDGRCRSVQHRVRLGAARLSVPFFLGLPVDFPLKRVSDEVPRTFGEHIAGRLIWSFPHLRDAFTTGRLLPGLRAPQKNPFRKD